MSKLCQSTMQHFIFSVLNLAKFQEFIYLFIYLFFKEICHIWTLFKNLIAIILTSFLLIKKFITVSTESKSLSPFNTKFLLGC
jgi:hypothetical protein